MEPQNKKRRLFYIDFIRAASMLIIIIFHFNEQVQLVHPDSPIVWKNHFRNVNLDSLGVGLFVMLSGASLMLSYGAGFNAVEFYRKRLLSILPLYWVSYAAAAAFVLFMTGHLPQSGNPWTFLLTITGMDGFLLYKIPNYYLIGEWFLGMIMCLYLVFPVLRLAVLKSPIGSMIGSLLIVGAVHHFYGRLFDMVEFRNPLILFAYLVFGMVFTRFFDKAGWKSLAALLIAAVAVAKAPIVLPYVFKVFLVCAVAFCLMAAFAERVSIGKTMRAHIETIAKYSFAMFLAHHILIAFLISPRYTVPFTDVEVRSMCGLTLALTFCVGVALDHASNRIIMPFFRRHRSSAIESTMQATGRWPEH